MSNLPVIGVRPNGAADQAAALTDAAPREVDLATWFSQDETCRILGWSRRTLNEKIAAGKGPEKRMRPMEGRKDAPFYNPEDVERIRAAQEPKPAVFAADSGVGPRSDSDSTALAAPIPDLMTFISRFAERQLVALERITEALTPAKSVDRGPWLDLDAAAERTHLSKTVLRRALRRKLEEGCPDVFRERTELRIRQGALDSFTAVDLQARRAARPIPAAQSVVAL